MSDLTPNLIAALREELGEGNTLRNWIRDHYAFDDGAEPDAIVWCVGCHRPLEFGHAADCLIPTLVPDA